MAIDRPDQAGSTHVRYLMAPATAPIISLPPGERHALASVDGKTMTVRFRGHDLTIRKSLGSGVLFPTDFGLSLLKALEDETSAKLAGKRVLDAGCGSGIYTAAAVADGALVTALDISSACVEATLDCIRANSLAVSSVDPITADLATMVVSEPWDVVLANPPHFPDDPAYVAADGLQAALLGGADGRALYDILLSRIDDLVAPGGLVVLAHSSLTNVQRTARELLARGYSCRTALITELDMPLRQYTPHRHQLLARLYRLRSAGSAAFCGLRMQVNVLIATRATTTEQK